MLGWLGALKDFPEKQDPGMCLLRGQPPQKKQKQKNKQTREVKEKEKKPVDERLQGEAHFSESFAASMEPHSGIGLISHF